MKSAHMLLFALLFHRPAVVTELPAPSPAVRQELWENAKDRYHEVSERMKQLGVSVELAAEDIAHGKSPVDSMLRFNVSLTSENTMKMEIETSSGGGEGASDMRFAGSFEWGEKLEKLAGKASVSTAGDGLSSEYSYNRENSEQKWEIEGNRSIWDTKIQMVDLNAGPVATGIKVGPLKVLVDPYVMAKELVNEAPKIVESATEAVQKLKLGGISTRINLTDLAYVLANSPTPPPNFARKRVVVSLKALVQDPDRGPRLPISHLDGVMVDSEKGDVSLYGLPAEGDDGISVSVLSALTQAEYVDGTHPYISIDPDWDDFKAKHHARVGGIADSLKKSELIRGMLISDYQMKRVFLGISPVKGVVSIIDLLKSQPEKWQSLAQRFWIVPRPLVYGDVRVARNAKQVLYQFDSQPFVRTSAISRDDGPDSDDGPGLPEAELEAEYLTSSYQQVEQEHPEFGFAQVRRIFEISTALAILRSQAIPDAANKLLLQVAALPTGKVEVPQTFEPVRADLGQINGRVYYVIGGVVNTPELVGPTNDRQTAAALNTIGQPGSVQSLAEETNPEVTQQDEDELFNEIVAYSYQSLGSGDEADALRFARLACTLRPDSPQGYSALAWAESQAKDYTAMLAAAEKAVELDPKSFEAHNARAYAMMYKGASSDAWLKALEAGTIDALIRPVLNEALAAMDLDPNKPASYMLLAILFGIEQDEQSVVLDCTAALEVDPSYYPALASRAQAYFRLKDFKNARHDVAAYIAERPATAEIRKLQIQLAAQP